MNKILAFLKKSDIINNSYAKNIYQINEVRRVEENNTIIEKKAIIFSVILVTFLTLFSQKLSMSFQPSLISTFCFIFFVSLSVYITVFLYEKQLKSMRKEVELERDIVDKGIKNEFLNELNSIFGFKPREELLIKINLIAKEPFLTDGEKIEKINILLFDYKKNHIFEEFESRTSPAKKKASKSINKKEETPIKKNPVGRPRNKS